MNVVITGASKGIGKAVAERFASGGADLFLCSRNMDATIGWQQALMQKYNIAICVANADLQNKNEVLEFGEKVLNVFDNIDVLVNNAGLFEPGSVHNEADGALEKMIEVNLYSAYHLTRILLPIMMKRKSGHIFNICSIAALQAYHNGGAYSISKWALLGFSKNLREEMKTHGIKVTAVIPGATMTDSWTAAGIDTKRIMETRDIAQMIFAASLLSPQACVEEILLRPQLGDL
jgi:short-subunit dehydrogenase